MSPQSNRRPLEAQAVEGHIADRSRHGVGQLDFAARARLMRVERRQHRGIEHIAPDNGERRGGVRRGRLLHKAPDRGEPSVIFHNVQHAVAAGFLPRHVHDRDDIAAMLAVDVEKLAEAGPLREHEVVRQEHGEGCGAHDMARAPDRMAEAERRLLPDMHDRARRRHHLRCCGPQFLFAARRQRLVELRREVEMVLHRRLAARGHEHDGLDARSPRFLDRILDQRLVHHRQHFLRHRLRRRQEARAEPAGRDDRRLYRSRHG